MGGIPEYREQYLTLADGQTCHTKLYIWGDRDIFMQNTELNGETSFMSMKWTQRQGAKTTIRIIEEFLYGSWYGIFILHMAAITQLN